MNKINLDNIIKSAKQFEADSQKLFAQFEGNPHKTNFWPETISKVESLQDETKKKFLKEAIGCAEKEFFRAAIVLAWCAISDYLRDICTKYNDYLYSCIKEDKKNQDDKKDLEEIKVKNNDSRLIDVICKYKLITPQNKKDLIDLLNDRNKAAHPSDEDFTQTITFSFIQKQVIVINKIEKYLKENEEKFKKRLPSQN